MNKTVALSKFYEFNNLNYEQITDSDNDALYDSRIDNLPEKTDEWLNSFDVADQDIFLELLSKYTYLSYSSFLKRIKFLINLIIEKYSFAFSEILFVTVESNKGVKCGGDEISTGIHKRYKDKIDKNQIIRSISIINEEKINTYKAVIFIDDIIGTGFTSYKSIKNFLERFHLKENMKLILAPLIISRGGKNFIENRCKAEKINIEIINCDILKSAFVGGYIFDGKLVKEKEDIVARYEEIFDEYNKEVGKSYVFGFGKSKLLVSTYYETPNNTLCSFWKITDQHKPLFARDGQIKHTDINELKRKKNANQKHAYEIGIIESKENDIIGLH